MLFFYPKFWKNGFAYLFWIAVIGVSPALIVGFDALPQLYSDWLVCLADDHGATEKERYLMSLMHLINAFSPVVIPFVYIQISGVIALLCMLVYTRFFKENTLTAQAFVKDGGITVASYIQQVDKDAKVISFKRVALG